MIKRMYIRPDQAGVITSAGTLNERGTGRARKALPPELVEITPDDLPPGHTLDECLYGTYDAGTHTITLPPPYVEPTHALQMTGAQFKRLFTPQEFRKIKRERDAETPEGLVIDQLWSIAESQNTVDMESDDYAAAAGALVDSGCVTQPRMDEISRGYPL